MLLNSTIHPPSSLSHMRETSIFLTSPVDPKSTPSTTPLLCNMKLTSEEVSIAAFAETMRQTIHFFLLVPLGTESSNIFKDLLTLAARKFPLATLTPTSCQRLLSPCRRILEIGGPGESLASIISLIPPAASIAAASEFESVILYCPTYFGLEPALKKKTHSCFN